MYYFSAIELTTLWIFLQYLQSHSIVTCPEFHLNGCGLVGSWRDLRLYRPVWSSLASQTKLCNFPQITTQNNLSYPDKKQQQQTLFQVVFTYLHSPKVRFEARIRMMQDFNALPFKNSLSLPPKRMWVVLGLTDYLINI